MITKLEERNFLSIRNIIGMISLNLPSNYVQLLFHPNLMFF